jgi:hypothetical protein
MPTSLADRLKLLVDWFPVALLLQRIAASEPGRSQAAAVMELVRFLASKTEIEMDDRLADMTTKLLATKEGGELLDYVVTLVNRPRGV